MHATKIKYTDETGNAIQQTDSTSRHKTAIIPEFYPAYSTHNWILEDETAKALY